MRNSTLALAFVLIQLNSAWAAPRDEMDVCETRATMIAAIAKERDGGKGREEVKRAIPPKLAAMKPWVDLVYDKMQGMSPTDVYRFIKTACQKSG